MNLDTTVIITIDIKERRFIMEHVELFLNIIIILFCIILLFAVGIVVLKNMK